MRLNNDKLIVIYDKFEPYSYKNVFSYEIRDYKRRNSTIGLYIVGVDEYLLQDQV